MRELTEQEQTIKKLCQEKYGAHAQDEVFFLESGEAMFQAWGTDGNGPWVHLANLVVSAKRCITYSARRVRA